MRGAKDSVYFVTSNRGKYIEASRIAATYGVRLRHLNLPKKEIQSDKLEEIASHAAITAAESKHVEVVSEDAGLFVDALKGFPGPYSSYVFRTLGLAGVLKLTRNIRNRKARFRAVVAYCKPNMRPRCFKGSVRGSLSQKPRGSHGFGFDPIFIPLDGDGRTFAEMNTAEKNHLSHRAKAFAEFAKWYRSSRKAKSLVRQVK